MESNLSTSDADAAFGLFANALNPRLFPAGDVEDMAQGATHIPSEVTDARRAGQQVSYVLAHCRYWQIPSDKRIYENPPPCESCKAAPPEQASNAPAEADRMELPEVPPIDITGIDSTVLAFALLDGAKLSPLHVLRPHISQTVTMAMAEYLVIREHLTHGWFCGRAFMVDLSDESFDPRLYDMFNGPGAAERAVLAARAYTPPPPPESLIDPVYQVKLSRWRQVPTRANGVRILADVHFVEAGTEQVRSIGFGRITGHLPSFWMTQDDEDLSRFHWQAVSCAVNAPGVQALIYDFSVGGSDPGDIEGQYVQSSAAYDPHVTLYPHRGSSNSFEYRAWQDIDRILNAHTFADEVPSRGDDDAVFVCLRFFSRNIGDEFLRVDRSELGGKSLLAAHNDASNLRGKASSQAVFRVLQVAARLLVEALTELRTTTSGWLGSKRVKPPGFCFYSHPATIARNY